MKWSLFILRRWDDLTHLFERDGFKLPKHKHGPMTTEQMSQRVQDALNVVMEAAGFTIDGELLWTRPHPSIGYDVFSVQLLTKHAPEFLRVSLGIGFRVPVIEHAIAAICGSRIKGGENVDRTFSRTLLIRTFNDPDRPKKRSPIPLSYTLWNMDFRESTVKRIVRDVELYAVPYFENFKCIGDLRAAIMNAESNIALMVYLGEHELALQFIQNELQKAKLYGPEMLARLELMRNAIKTGEFQKALLL